MKNYAVIENGKVVNTVVAVIDYDTAQSWVELVDSAGIGWSYASGQFIDNRPKPQITAPPAAPTKEQLMAQLNALSAQIQALE